MKVARERWLAAALIAAAASGGCAGLLTHNRRDIPRASLDAWRALADGDRAAAERGFDASLRARAPGPEGAPPADPTASFGRASIAYERGDSETAAAEYAEALLEIAAARPRGLEPLASVAAIRIGMLYDELPVAARARLARRLSPVEMSARVGLPWLARVELARLGDQIARQALDVARLAAVAAAAGCADQVFDAGTLGPLANLDLGRPVTARPSAAPGSWLPVSASGCRLDVAAPADGRGGARQLELAMEVPAGQYDVVLEHAGEGMLVFDHSVGVQHGARTGYGPRMSAVRVKLAAGRHDLEVRIASGGGRAAIALLVLAVDGDDGVRRNVRFVDPRRAAPSPVAPTIVAMPAATSPEKSPALEPLMKDPGMAAVFDYCAAANAWRVEDAETALGALARLRQRPQFALGLALAGTLARDDVTRPSNLGRDAARGLFRSAVAADAGLARAWYALATVELDDDRPREGIDAARAAIRAAPRWWMPELLLARALGSRGLDYDSQRAIEQAAGKGGVEVARSTPTPDSAGVAAADPREVPCAVLEALRRNAEQRRVTAREAKLTEWLEVCGGRVEARVDWLRARGRNPEAITLLGAALGVDPDRDDLAGDLALLLAAEGRPADGVGVLAPLAAREPSDPWRRMRLADAQVAAGGMDAARATIGAALALRPDVPEIRRAARALDLPSPLDADRIDGAATIRAFEAAGKRYAAPAVMVLDRSVMRVFPTGAMMVLTHQIIRVDSKEAIDRWGEIPVPAGADILTLRTHKPDGSTREPEEIAGKENVSAPDLAIGDYVEWELVETRAPSAAFAPGFLADRFYFQSFDSPLARTELVLVTPAGVSLAVDRRAGAPAPQSRPAIDGTLRTTFAAIDVPQLYAERAAVLPVEYVPSVRVSSGVGWGAWARYVAEELHASVRSSPEVRAQAKQLHAQALGDARPTKLGSPEIDRRALAATVVDWVTENIEAGSDFGDPASFTLAHRRGSRLALALALAREVGLPARAVLARSRLVADAGAATPPQELDDFADALIEIDVGERARPALLWADLRLRHAALGYLPPGLDGARALSLPGGDFLPVRSSASQDHRSVDMTIRLDEHGGGIAVATEDLVGWPALEWAERVDQLGADRARLRQDFEQRWLGVQFPGARLRELEVELPPRDRAGGRGTARVRYSFASSRLAVPIERNGPGNREMRLEPTFFRSQPGRRFAVEPQRNTALVLGFDVPVRLTATVELPGAARVETADDKDVVISRRDGYRFVEERRVRQGTAGTPSALLLRRESALPIMRVTPGEYAAVAADLRRVDGVEQEEIRIRFAPGARGGVK